MKIVTKNSLTLSNVNDGTITHYAYANSADGTDGFYVGGGTNLLQGTQDFSGSNWLNLGSVWEKTDETYNGLSVVETTSDWSGIAQYYQVKQDETYTFSLFARYTSGTGTSNFYISLNSDPESGHKNAQVNNGTLACSLDTNWKKCSITFTATADGYVKPRMERSNNNTNVLRVCGFMFEKGTVAHPWSPAPSEAHPSYIGQYTDFNTTASTDPTKYAPWIIFKGSDGKDGLKGDTGGILGENMWIGHKYSYSGSTRIYPSFDHIQGINPIATRIFDDSTQFTFNDDYYIAHFQSNLYVNIDKQITTTVIHDDDLTIYCNDEVVVSKNTTIFTPYNITFNLKAGWNKIDILLHEIVGGDQVAFGTKLSSLVDHLSYIKGADGVGLKTTVITYAISTSSTTAPTTGWTSSVPTLIKGQYLWTKTDWTYTDNSSKTGYSVTYISKDGINGNNGTGIQTTTITYASSTSGTTVPTSGWTSTIPIVAEGSYLWTKTVWTYTDNSNSTGYSVAKMGNDGTITHTAWSWSADGSDRFTTIYPNLNLLDGTSTTYKNIEHSANLWGADNNTTTMVSPKIGSYRYSAIISSDKYDLCVEVGLFDTTGKFIYNTRGNVVVKNTEGLSTVSFTVNETVGSIKLRPTIATQGNPESFVSKQKMEKLEYGSIATPWMPSSSEVKTSDYPSYIGTYLDKNVESSSDYKRYQWTIFKGQDSNAYTAYSWSSDGTDRFTTVYPSLNLLKGTKTPKSITGNNTVNQGGLLFPFDNDKTLANQGFSINDTLTLEFDWNATNPTSGTFILQWQGTPWDLKVPTIKLSSTNGSGHVIHTYNIRAVDIDSTATAIGIGYRLDNIPTNTVITFSNATIRKTKSSQPWMPSESEAQEQWQDAIPMYVGVGEKDSQNPSDYRWQLNPRYVQASSDSGLSNKAGVDDLASVANTANDALVQAQNAVSNEDYTSWLEHDYQSTINNLQDVSAKNQEDIKNVDNRTTIVEGFYGEMKVKWNFIDESFSFSEEGMFISNTQSKMSIQITSDKIVFWDNNVDVAFITGEVLNIQKGVFLESATIGNHLITKFSDDSPVTIIRYVGGIT